MEEKGIQKSLHHIHDSYGNVVVEVSASGGYHKDILLRGIVNPKKYERILNEFLEKKKKY